MKRTISIILCLIMMFITAAVPALAQSGGAEWVEVFKEDFTGYSEGESFDSKTYQNANAYIGYPLENPSSKVTNTVSAYDGNNAFKIQRTGKGDKRIYFQLNEPLSGQVKISFKVLTTSFISGCAAFDIFAASEDNSSLSTLISGFTHDATKIYTRYLTTAKEDDSAFAWGANKWLNVSYEINTQTGVIVAKYSGENIDITHTVSGQANISAVGGFCVRSGSSTNTFDLYADDILVEHYRLPQEAEPEFAFSKISRESINAVTNQLNLINQFTDEDGKLWYITWVSANEDVIDSETGEVTPTTMDERVKLTAHFTNSGTGGETEVRFSKVFNVKVLAAGTYHMKEGFDAPGDYSGLNAIAQYTGDGGAVWSVGSNYGDTDKITTQNMNANISTDPENQQNKVLKLYRKSSGTTQRVWTSINSDTTKFNEKMYVGMRILREKNGAATDVYANDAAGTRIMRVRFNTDNSITYYYGENIGKNSKSAAEAPAGKWFDFTIELDIKTGSYNAYIDGQSILSTAQTSAVSQSGFGGLTFDVDRNATEECTVYFDDLTMRTVGGMPYVVADYSFTDVNGYPTRSMVEGGYLKSVKMKKMSSVDAESEPTLYVCFFKGELLYDVISAPLDEKASLGGFDVTLNEALPENVLDYNIKAFVFSNTLVALADLSEYVPFAANPTIYVSGDSIAKSYAASEYPMVGYGQVLGENFDGNINIENHAEGSRSSKSFIAEGRLKKILDKICSGDYLFIQFGHNDDKIEGDRYVNPVGDKYTEGSFRYYLMQYIDGARAKGATPVLITPPGSNSFNAAGELHDSDLLKYVTVMRALADEEEVALVDLYADWKTFIDNRDKSIDSRNFYMYLHYEDARFINDEAFKQSKYHKDNIGSQSLKESLFSCYFDDDTSQYVHADGTHFNAYTARIAAKFIAKQLADLNIGLTDNVIDPGEILWPWNGYATFGNKASQRN